MFLTLKTDWDLSTKDTYAFLRQKNIFELSELNPFKSRKIDVIFHIIDHR